ncbi:MAG: erythromycin esterase family protein [Myxococcota bacterium]
MIPVEQAAHPITGSPRDYDDLLDRIGDDVRVVLLGEGTHGTHEFYRERARLTRRLVAERGFDAVAIEGDWPDTWRVNRYVAGMSEDRSAREALSGFERFPAWMWRNLDVVAFVDWLHASNRRERRGAGIFGLDLYSFHRSADAVVRWLRTFDPAAAKLAAARYRCFRLAEEPQHYGWAAARGMAEGCDVAVREQLADVLAVREGDPAGRFDAVQNARVVVAAEAYYRAMYGRRTSSWNLRDTFMADTLDGLLAHLAQRFGRPSRVVVWAHNSHVGDARASEMGSGGEISLGQLARERWGAQAFLVGFTTFTGTVTAASEWGGEAERKRVLPGRADSWEGALHDAGLESAWLDAKALAGERLERAIGVLYLPETERMSHYFTSRMADRFDVVIHVDHTTALQPLERTATWEMGEAETWPSAL